MKILQRIVEKLFPRRVRQAREQLRAFEKSWRKVVLALDDLEDSKWTELLEQLLSNPPPPREYVVLLLAQMAKREVELHGVDRVTQQVRKLIRELSPLLKEDE